MNNQVKLIVTTDANQTTDALKKIGNNATTALGEKAVKAAEASEGGFRLVGVAAARLGEELGVPFHAAMLLGTRVEDLTKNTFPAWGLALGGVGIAITAAIILVQKLTDNQKQMREELGKQISEMSAVTDELYKNTIQSQAMTRALFEQAQVYREILQLKMADKYQDLYEQMKKASDEAQKGPAWYKTFGIAMKELTIAFFTGKNGAEELEKTLILLRQNGGREALKLSTDLEVLYQQMLRLNKNVTIDTFAGYGTEKRLSGEIDFYDAWDKLLKLHTQNFAVAQQLELAIFDKTTASKVALMLSAEEKKDYLLARSVEHTALIYQQEIDAGNRRMVAYEKGFDRLQQKTAAYLLGKQNELNMEEGYTSALFALSRARGDTIEEQQQREVAAFNAAAAAKYNILKTEDEQQAFFAQNEINRGKMLLVQQQERDKALLTLHQLYSQSWLEGANNAFTSYAASNDKNAKEMFYLQKALAIASIYVNTANAATAAMANTALYGGPVGAATAAGYIWALGEANMAIVAATALFTGAGKSGGGGAVGTYSANAATGLPESSIYSADYGTGWRPGEGQDRMRGGNTYVTIQGNIYPHDSTEFKQIINNAVQENIADGGKTKTTIQKYV